MRKPRKGKNKSEFVRTMPGAKASDVVAAAKKKGIELTERYVYVIRSSDKARGRTKGASGGRGRGRQKAGGTEADLRRAIAEIGLSKAREILEEVEREFGA